MTNGIERQMRIQMEFGKRNHAWFRFFRLGRVGPFTAALIVQGVLLLSTAFVIVLVPSGRTDPKFSARKTIYLPQRELEHRMAVAEYQEAMSEPVMLNKITTAALLPDDLPQAPAAPQIDYDFMGESNPTAQLDALLGMAGVQRALRQLTSEESQATLFGIEDAGKRFVLLVDDGGTMINKARRSGVPVSAIREQAVKLIEGLNANTLFGIVHFVRRVGTFQDVLLPATMGNKRLIKEWIENTLATGKKKRTELPIEGNGIEAALEVAYRLEPDVIFLLSDADFQRYAEGSRKSEQVPWDDVFDTLRRLEKVTRKEVRLNFIGFQVEDDDRRQMRRLVRRTGGKYRDF